MQPRAIDLFAGCGGLSLGLQEAGYRVVLASEIDASACLTYAANHPDTKLLEGDVRDVSSAFWRGFEGQVDLLAGGPPCQGFSMAGRRQFGEIPAHNTLVEAFLDVVEWIRPRQVLIENVAAFRTAKMRPGRPALPFVLERLKALGYTSSVGVLQAANFGVPSLRSRLFVFAASDGGYDPFVAPELRHASEIISCLDAISDLPMLDAGEGQEEPVPYPVAPRNAYQERMREGSRGVQNHVAMRHTPRLVQRFESIEPGGSSYSLPEGGITVYKSNNQRLVGDQPSLCVTANFQSNYIHPIQHRNLTAREAARLMTFPDWYVFRGKRTLMSRKFLEKYGRHAEIGLSQYNQIGNSVPPVLAKFIGEVLLRGLEGQRSSAIAA
jgi:DNA (cytosine-5)-methyltransferase 1